MGTKEAETRERIIARAHAIAKALAVAKNEFDSGRPVKPETYGDAETAAALVYRQSMGASTSVASNDSEPTVSTIEAGPAMQDSEPEVVKKNVVVRERLSSRLEDAAHQMVDAIPVKIETASLRDLGATLGVVIDKMRLLREEPTNITEVSPGPREMLELLIKRTLEKFPGTTREEAIEAIRDVRPEAIKFLS